MKYIKAATVKILSDIIGGSRGSGPGVRPPKGPDSFVLTYKFYEM